MARHWLWPPFCWKIKLAAYSPHLFCSLFLTSCALARRRFLCLGSDSLHWPSSPECRSRQTQPASSLCIACNFHRASDSSCFWTISSQYYPILPLSSWNCHSARSSQNWMRWQKSFTRRLSCFWMLTIFSILFISSFEENSVNFAATLIDSISSVVFMQVTSLKRLSASENFISLSLFFV